MIPDIPVNRGAERYVQSAFGGIDRRPGARSGVDSKKRLALVVRSMKNAGWQKTPLLATRRARRTAATLTKPNGLTTYDGRLAWVDGTSLIVDGVAVGSVSDTEKVFATLGSRLLIWPDKKMWDGTTLSSLEASFTASGLVFGDGTYAGEDAKANSVTTGGSEPFPFKVGDAVTITGCAVEPANNKTPIVREISDDGKTLRFYENTFTIPEGETSVTETGSVTLARTVPDLDFLCVNENRVWGCRGDTICCSKLGDPTNWNVFDGISTDAWSVESGTQGGFTACFSFMGYPIFFKEDRVFKVYGNRPSNFELMGAATLGVLPGCEKSLAVAGETLFYLSRAGVVAYTGGFPAIVGGPLDDAKTVYRWAAAGSDGARYYVCLGKSASAGTTEIFVYDTRTGAWTREDEPRVVGWAWSAYHGGLFALTGGGSLRSAGNPPVTEGTGWSGEAAYETAAEFGDLDMGVFGGKYPVRLWLRYETVLTATVKVYVRYDGGAWELAGTLPAKSTAGTADTPVPIRRCDHFALKLVSDAAAYDTTNALAGFTLYGIMLETVMGEGRSKA